MQTWQRWEFCLIGSTIRFVYTYTCSTSNDIEHFWVFMFKPHTRWLCAQRTWATLCAICVANAKEKSVQSTKLPHQTKDTKAIASSCNVIWNCKPYLHFIAKPKISQLLNNQHRITMLIRYSVGFIVFIISVRSSDTKKQQF